jgi:hypothetical protein
MDVLDIAFSNKKFQRLVEEQLPSLIERANTEAAKYGKTGMEKGSVRKRYLIDFLIEYFGEDRVKTTFSGDVLGVDLKINSLPVKIKTITGKGAVKITWTTDKDKLDDFISDYTPVCGILLVRINWEMDEKNRPSGLFWIPIEVQNKICKKLDMEKYLKLPKRGTNSRGVPFSKQALDLLLKDKDTKHIEINWRR